MVFKNLIGLRFERLLVIELYGKNKKSILWKCLCDCGKETIVGTSSLTSKNTKSCGCLQRERASETNFRDMTGKRFGKLTAVKAIGKDKFRSYIWECLCDCGNTSNVPQNLLYEGNTRSCGCSSKESYMAQDLKQYFSEKYSAVCEYNALINPKTGYPLSFDIYIPIRNIFIEIMGSQHYEYVQYYHENKEGFEYSIYKDKIKKKYAEKNGIYIEIDMRETKQVSIAIEKIEKIIQDYDKLDIL